MNGPAFECRGLTKYFARNPALLDINITLPAGKIIGLLGPNGSGKTTLIKLACGLLTPTEGRIRVCGHEPGIESKALVSYLPERTYLPEWMTAIDCLRYFRDFYADFDYARAVSMLQSLQVPADAVMKTLSKGTKEKVQLVLVMSRRARLYLLDEPIGGVDPAAREYILETILKNYSEDSTVLISTHLIADVEKVLDEFIFLQNGQLVSYASTDSLREDLGKSIDQYFREVFRC
ncbi:MAG: ABC transporter ATP-binding protein [Oscillospiraceae bacterium]|jgi:ABC-2 type transport system ATP-binding protein|nr:ABC transporter ATP-binding protein [Oscillospiraceae bacterium]